MGYEPSLRERVATEVRAELARQRKTQAELAAHLGISQMAVSRRLNSEVGMDFDELDSIARWLGVPFGQFLQVGAA